MHDFQDFPIASAPQGVLRTWLKIKERFYWPHPEIKKYIDSCRDCLSNKKKIGKLYGILRPILGNKVGERWEIDHGSPLKTFNRKKKVLTVVIEQVKEWVVAKADSSESAEESARFLSIK